MHYLLKIKNHVQKKLYNRQRFIEQNGILAYLKNDTGYILIIVLIVSALLITISGDFFIATRTDIGYMTRFRDDAQAQEIARSGLTFAQFLLEIDRTGRGGSFIPGRNANASIDCYDDIWAFAFPTVPVDDASVTFAIRDEQSKINLSIVANEFINKTVYYTMASRFLTNMDFTSEIAESILDWVDQDSFRSSNGAETFDFYSTLPRPYRAKNGPLDSIEELLLIKNITPEIYYGLGGGNYGKEENTVEDNMYLSIPSLDPAQNDDTKIPVNERRIDIEKSRALKEYFRAYGSNDYTNDFNRININTASYRVISALTDTMTPDKVTALIRRRMTKPFTSVNDVSDIIEDPTIREKNLSVSSQIFSITATGSYRGSVVTVHAVYNRAQKRFYYYGIR